MSPKLFILFICLAWFNFACQSQPVVDGISAPVKRIVSGQTIEVIIEQQSYQFRLSGIDSPSIKQKPWGQDAQKFLSSILLSQNNPDRVTLETNLLTKDKFGRLQGYLWYNKQLINELLVEQGYAIANLTYTDGKYDQKLIDAQNYARIMGKGIWNPENPLKQIK